MAVAAARLGPPAAVVTKVGADPFGTYVRNKLDGVRRRHSLRRDASAWRTPLAFAALTPPEDPELLFYREPAAPDTDMQVERDRRRRGACSPILWVSASAMGVSRHRSRSSSACSTNEAERAHGARPRLPAGALAFDGRRGAPHRRRGRRSARSPSAIGSNARSRSGRPILRRRRDELLARGVEVAIVKQGGDGVLVATADGFVTVPARPVEVVCGLGAGDAFGGALCHGLLSGWSPAARGRVRQRRRCHRRVARLLCADAMPSAAEVVALAGGQPCCWMTAAFAELLDVRVHEPERDRRRPARCGRRRASVTPDGCCSSSPRTTRPAAWSGLGDDRGRWPIAARCSSRLLVALRHPRVDGVLGERRHPRRSRRARRAR